MLIFFVQMEKIQLAVDAPYARLALLHADVLSDAKPAEALVSYENAANVMLSSADQHGYDPKLVRRIDEPVS